MRQANKSDARRTLDCVLQDGLWPSGSLVPDPEESKRHSAIAEVLTRIPEEDYRVLKGTVNRWEWFVPHIQTRGQLYRWHAHVHPEEASDEGSTEADFVDMLYLGPQLETAAWGITVAVVAHELAHIVLGHSLTTATPEDYEAQELQVFERLCKWGFEKEARRHRTVGRWRESWEQTMCEKLIKTGHVRFG